MMIVAGPVTALPDAVRVRMLLVVVLEGLNEAATPAGRPLATRLTAPVKLLSPLTVTVLVPLLPCTTLTLFGEADSE